jgi:antirestriction protein ArdC
MQREEAQKIAADALARLTESLAQGKSESMTRYLAALAKFHKYSFGNVLMILAQRPDATRIAGFQTWRTLGRFVRKGEKGIAILAPMMIRPKGENESTASDSPDESKRAPILRFRVVHVFDVSQTDGEELPEPVSVAGEPGAALERLKSVVTERGIKLEYVDHLGGALGASFGGRIEIRSGQTPAEEFATLAHELAHELLHRGDDRPESKCVRETEAEAVAFVVCQAAGLESCTASSDYIALYSGDGKTLTESLERIQKTAAEILAAITADQQVSAAA